MTGSLHKFGPEAIARLRFAKKQRYITVDIQIPEKVWKPHGALDLRQYLSTQIEAAISICVVRLKSDGHTVSDGQLMLEISRAIGEYTNQPQGGQDARPNGLGLGESRVNVGFGSLESVGELMHSAASERSLNERP
jgi:hypothetical protein